MRPTQLHDIVRLSRCLHVRDRCTAAGLNSCAAEARVWPMNAEGTERSQVGCRPSAGEKARVGSSYRQTLEAAAHHEVQRLRGRLQPMLAWRGGRVRGRQHVQASSLSRNLIHLASSRPRTRTRFVWFVARLAAECLSAMMQRAWPAPRPWFLLHERSVHARFTPRAVLHAAAQRCFGIDRPRAAPQFGAYLAQHAAEHAPEREEALLEGIRRRRITRLPVQRRNSPLVTPHCDLGR